MTRTSGAQLGFDLSTTVRHNKEIRSLGSRPSRSWILLSRSVVRYYLDRCLTTTHNTQASMASAFRLSGDRRPLSPSILPATPSTVLSTMSSIILRSFHSATTSQREAQRIISKVQSRFAREDILAFENFKKHHIILRSQMQLPRRRGCISIPSFSRKTAKGRMGLTDFSTNMTCVPLGFSATV